MDGHAARPDVCYAQSLIEQQNIGIRSGPQRAFLEFDPQQRSGIQGQHANRVRQRNAKVHDVREGAVEVYRAAGQDPRGVRHTPLVTVTWKPPSMYFPSGMPVAESPSLTRMTRSEPLAFRSSFIAPSSTCTPSAINSALISGDVSTAPITPGSRCVKGRIAL